MDKYQLSKPEGLPLPKFKEEPDDAIYCVEQKTCYTLLPEKDDNPVIMDFYPKGNRLLIRNEHKWYNRGW